MGEDLDKRKLLSALSHGSIFVSALVLSVAIPIAILFISEDEIVKANAREALNFHFNVWLYGVIFGALVIVGIGFVLLWILGIVTLIMPILAILQVFKQPNEPYRYPFIFRLL